VSPGEQAKGRMRADDPVLVEQRQPAGNLQNTLDDEHHVGSAGIIFVENQRRVALHRPRQNAVTEFGDLLAVPDDDGVLADKVDTADMAVQIDAHHRPVEARGDLFKVGRFAGAVIAGDHHPPVVGKTGQDRQGRLAVELIILVEIGHMLVRL
jgi:hypothetical protein